jgi:hypothetical protein
MERRKELRFQPKTEISFNDLLDRYMALPFAKRAFVNQMFENSLNLVERDLETGLTINANKNIVINLQ